MVVFEITNKRIQNFYEKNPAISFEAVNLIFIDLFEKLLSDDDKERIQKVLGQQAKIVKNYSNRNHHHRPPSH